MASKVSGVGPFGKLVHLMLMSRFQPATTPKQLKYCSSTVLVYIFIDKLHLTNFV